MTPQPSNGLSVRHEVRFALLYRSISMGVTVIKSGNPELL